MSDEWTGPVCPHCGRRFHYVDTRHVIGRGTPDERTTYANHLLGCPVLFERRQQARRAFFAGKEPRHPA